MQAERSLWAAVLAEDMPRIAALSTEVEILTGAASTPAEGEPKSPGVSVEPPVSEEKEWVTCSALCCPLAAACCCDWLLRWCPASYSLGWFAPRSWRTMCEAQASVFCAKDTSELAHTLRLHPRRRQSACAATDAAAALTRPAQLVAERAGAGAPAAAPPASGEAAYPAATSPAQGQGQAQAQARGQGKARQGRRRRRLARALCSRPRPT